MTCQEYTEFPTIPANKISLAGRKTLFGVGVNDADYMVTPVINGKQVWCLFYRTWASMISRCYSQKLHAKRPTYVDCTVIKEWHNFMAFREWMTRQDWRGKQLDKDILQPGNKVYGPETCVFVSSQVNTLLLDCASARGEYTQGVYWDCRHKKFKAEIVEFGKTSYLGRYRTEKEASLAYRKAKRVHILKIASAETDIRIKQGLARHAALFQDN